MIKGVTTGYKALDEIIKGYGRSELIVIGSRRAMGKTGFMLSSALRLARHGLPVGIFSIEYPEKLLLKRMISLSSGFDLRSSSELQKFLASDKLTSIEELSHLPIYIDDTRALCVDDFEEKVQMLVEHDVRVVFIDYLQLMTGGRAGYSHREEENADIVRDLRYVARKYKITIVLFYSLGAYVPRKDKVETDDERMDNDMFFLQCAAYGTLMRCADKMILIHRKYWYDTGEDPNARLVVKDKKSGSQQTISLAFNPQTSEFSEKCHEYISDKPNNQLKSEHDKN